MRSDDIYENPNGCTAVIWATPDQRKAWKVNISNTQTGEHLKAYYFDTYEDAVTAAEKVFPYPAYPA